MNTADKDITIYAVGDIGPDRADPVSIFNNVTGVMNQGDVTFCHLEVNLSNRGIGPHGKEVAKNPETAAAMKEAGFDVVSFAGNHTLAAGIDAFHDTIKYLKEQNFHVIGVGDNIEEARKPAIVECKGTQIAFLDYNSILEEGHWAEVNRPGCAPLRVWTFYEPIEPYQPGTPSRVHTFPHRDDMSAMVEDIKKAKAQADIVIVSMHSGVHLTPAVIAGYQKDYARAAIDSGADLILQHHAHILKGIEVYSGKVIFYGLGNFAVELHFMTKEWAEIPAVKEVRRALNPDWNPPYPDYPSFPFPPDSRKTIIAKCIISNKAINSVSFLPAYINKKSEPEILVSEDGRFGEVLSYMKEISRDQGLNTEYTVDGDEIVINR